MAKKKKAGAKKTPKAAKKAKAGGKKVARKKAPARGAPRTAAKKKAAKKRVKKAAPKRARKAAKRPAAKKRAAKKPAARKPAVKKPAKKPTAEKAAKRPTPRRPQKAAAPPPLPMMEQPPPFPEEQLPGGAMPGFEEPEPGALDVESEIEEGPTLYEPDEPRSEQEGEEEDEDEDSPRGRGRASSPSPAVAHAGSPQERAELRPGMPAPDFALSDETGEMHTLASYRGRRVVLYFYPRDNTPGCTREACGFRDTLDDFEQRNAVVLGVSPDAPESHAAFAKKHNLTFPLLADETHAVAQRYGAWGEKRGRGGQVRMGMLRTSFVIDEAGRIAHVFRQVNPDGHEQEILDFLDQMPRTA
jgi:peroxiredoxin Q/BCP